MLQLLQEQAIVYFLLVNKLININTLFKKKTEIRQMYLRKYLNIRVFNPLSF